MEKFNIKINKKIIIDIKNKVKNFNWKKIKDIESWDMGTNKSHLEAICNHWISDYSWEKEEARINSFKNFKAKVNNLDIHFIYEKSKNKNAIPLLISHGWPGSIIEFLRIIKPLTCPEEFGIDKIFSFDVVVPSLPGFVFSDPPSIPFGPRKIASLYNILMTKILGYKSYLSQGGDWGGAISSWLGYDYENTCKGIHLNIMIMRDKNGPISKEEKKWEKEFSKKQVLEEGYRSLQSTKPQTLAYSMVDNPVGVAAWIIEKFYGWSDLRKKEFLRVYDVNDIITNIMLYLVTDSFNTSTWIYYGRRLEGGRILNYDNKKVNVPTACALYPREFLMWPPKSYADRLYNIVQWNKFSEGGHFAAMERPSDFLNDIRKFSLFFRK